MRRNHGFTLLEISVSLVVMGLLAGIFLQLKHSDTTDCNAVTKVQLSQVERSMHDFVIAHDRFPVPALRTAGVEDTQFGREAPLASLDANGGILFGALPFQALGLAPKFAGDCWGNKFTYVVTADLTDAVKFKSNAPIYDGLVQLKTSASTVMNSKIAYAVISHGADGVGAVKINYSDATNTNRRWCQSSGIIETMNCSVNSTSFMAAEFNDGKDAGTNLFDDLLIYGGKEQRIVNGQCDNSFALGCLKGSVSNDNGLSLCGTTRTWHCDGANGGTNDTSCTRANPVCLNCAPATLTWGAGCNGSFPATNHGAISAPATGNVNPAFTPSSNASASCNNGVFSTPFGTCTALPPATPGVCNNAVPLGCLSGGAYISDNGATACGTIHTWICPGQNGGPNSPLCSYTNAACQNCGAQSLGWGTGCAGSFPATPNGGTTVPTTNVNPSYTGTGTATCSNGLLTASGTCTPVVPVPGACNNAAIGGCAAGTLNVASLTNNGVCGTMATWTCDGQNNGPPDTSCTASNAPCTGCGDGGLEWHGQCNDGVNSQVNCNPGEKPVFGAVAQYCIDGTYYSSVSCAPDASCSSPCAAQGLNEGEGNMTGGPGCRLDSCCGGVIVTTFPTICPNAGYNAGGGNCAATCNPATVANGSVAPAPACTITCNTGYTLNGSTCVSNSGCTNPNNLYAANQWNAVCTGNVTYLSWQDANYINANGVRAYLATHPSKCVGFIDMEPQGGGQADTAGSLMVISNGGIANQASIYNMNGYPYPAMSLNDYANSGMVGAPGQWGFMVVGACN